MTKKRFRVNELVKYNYSEIGEYIDENHTDRPLRNDILVELLNELHEENDVLKQELKTKVVVNRQYEELQKLKQENEQLKKILNELSDMFQFDVENGIRSYPVKLSEYLSNALKELGK